MSIFMATPFEAENINDSRICICISISEDAMEVWATFISDVGQVKPLSTAHVDSLLQASNIVYGICQEAILKAINEYTETKKQVERVLIAQGDEPVTEVPPYFEMWPKFDPRAKNGIDASANEQIDYREFSPFTIVPQNEYLAVLRPGTPGKNGVNVYGVELPFETVPEESIMAGNNIRIEEEGMYAGLYSTVNGQLLCSDSVLHVETSLEIQGSVGYATGHINFPGNILIHGFVNDGFKLYSGGSITCKQILDVTDVACVGDLEVNGGIIGRQQASIKVGANMHVRFMEHCNLECKGNINVGTEIVNSTVHTMGQINMGDGSSIIASDIHAFHSVYVTNIENRSGKTSSFHIGIDYTMIESVNESKKHLEEISKKLAKAEARIASTPANQKGYFEDVRRRVAARQQVAEENLNALLAKMYVNEDAVLQIAGEVARGTQIEIGRALFKVVAPMQNICFKLNEQRNHIVFDKYESDPASKLKFISVRRKPKDT
jgi:uncharacterized protein (DUF342 family)